MRSRFDYALKEINDELIEMGNLLEVAFSKVLLVLDTPDESLLKEIIDIEIQVDQLENSIQSKALKIICFQHPIAGDLRSVSTAINMITDMERIADQIVDIVEICMLFKQKKMIKKPEHIFEMIEICKYMINRSLDSFIKKDISLANEIIKMDDKVDSLFMIVRDELIELIKQDKNNGEQAIDFIMISKYLERIADHTVNLAEWVIFNVTGEHKNNQLL